MYIVVFSGDTTAPTLTCPSDQTVISTTGQPVAVTFDQQATGTDDNGGVVTFTYNPASGSTFNVDTTTVTVTGSDPSGNEATCTFDVIVTSGMKYCRQLCGITANRCTVWRTFYTVSTCIAVMPFFILILVVECVVLLMCLPILLPFWKQTFCCVIFDRL